ncbi:MAG: T9SS type A sorting domain-containing protein [Ignavibacteria bacterium]|jgi:hypothetical protein|nr:T9SS type A sorting domain-containing protein [Ignavibacteria bacterium]
MKFQKTITTLLLFTAFYVGVAAPSIQSDGVVLSNSDILSSAGNPAIAELNARYTRNIYALATNNERCAYLNSRNITTENAADECLAFLKKNTQLLGINTDNLYLYNVVPLSKSILVVFMQKYDNYEVRNSLVQMYVKPDGTLYSFNSTYYDDIELNHSKPQVSLQAIENAATYGLTGEYDIVTKEQPFIFPYFENGKYNYTPAYECTFTSQLDKYYSAVVDASNGKLLERRNLVSNVAAKINAKQYDGDANNPLIVAPLRNISITYNGKDYQANNSGTINNFPDDAVGGSFTTNLRGYNMRMYSVNYPATSSTNEYSYTGTISSDGIDMLDSNNYDEVFRTIYNSVSIVNNYYKIIDPAFGGVAGDVNGMFSVYVQLLPAAASLTSMAYPFNAYASGESKLTFLFANHINVFFAKSAPTAYHEYGHSMVYAKYRACGKPSGMQNGTANEANADITAGYIIDDPDIFKPDFRTGYSINMGLPRNLDNKVVFPDSLNGEVHDDSRILSGAFWDYRKLVDFDEAKSTVHFAKSWTPDGNTLDEVFANWFEALVKANEDWRDTDTEKEFEHNFDAINAAFTKHKIGYDLVIQNRFRHTNVEDQPSTTEPIAISCTLEDIAAPKDIEEFYINYYTNWSWEPQRVLLTKQVGSTGITYTGSIPAQSDATRLFYYFTCKNPFSGELIRINRDYFCFVGYTSLYKNTCETADGWSVVNSQKAENGWSLQAPDLVSIQDQKPWGAVLYSPGYNYTYKGQKCWTTQTSAALQGTNIMPNGLVDTSKLESHIMSFPNAEHLFLTYYKYLVNRINTNYNGLSIEVSFDGGGTWRLAQSFRGRTQPKNWTYEREYVNLTALKQSGEDFSNLKIRFVCNSNNTSNGVTAIIDDVELLNTSNPNDINDLYSNNEPLLLPNPATNEATVKFSEMLVNPQLSVTNPMGNEVMHISLQGEYDNILINTNELANGVYYVRIEAQGRIYNTKLTVIR